MATTGTGPGGCPNAISPCTAASPDRRRLVLDRALEAESDDRRGEDRRTSGDEGDSRHAQKPTSSSGRRQSGNRDKGRVPVDSSHAHPSFGMRSCPSTTPCTEHVLVLVPLRVTVSNQVRLHPHGHFTIGRGSRHV